MDFDEYLVGQGLADRSVTEYCKWVRRIARWCWANRLDLDTIGPMQLRQWATTTVPESWASRKQARAALGHYLRYLGRTDDAHDAIPVPRKPRHRSDALSADDARLLRDTAVMVGGKRGTATLCGLYLAARRAEIAGLTWDGWTGDTFTWRRPKSKDDHTVPVHPLLARQLEVYRQGATSAFLFPGNNGRAHVTPATVWTWVCKVGDIAEVDVTPKRLRSTCLTTALDGTRDLRAVQDLAGHRDPAVTAGYTRLSQQRLQATVDALTY